MILDSYISEGTNPKGTIPESLALGSLLGGKMGRGLQPQSTKLSGGAGERWVGGGSLSIQLHGPPNVSLQAWLRPSKPLQPNLPSPSPILA